MNKAAIKQGVHRDLYEVSRTRRRHRLLTRQPDQRSNLRSVTCLFATISQWKYEGQTRLNYEKIDKQLDNQFYKQKQIHP